MSKVSKFDVVESRTIGRHTFVVPVTENEVQSLFDVLCVKGILPYERLGHWRQGSSPDLRELRDKNNDRVIACELEYRSRALNYHPDSMFESYPNGVVVCWEHNDPKTDERFKKFSGWKVIELSAFCNPTPEEEHWGDISTVVQTVLEKNTTVQSWRNPGTYHIAHRLALLVNEFANDSAYVIHSGEKRWVSIFHKDTQKLAVWMRLWPEEEGVRLNRCQTKRIEIYYWVDKIALDGVEKRDGWPNSEGTTYSQYVMSSPEFISALNNIKKVLRIVKRHSSRLTDTRKHKVG